MSIPHDLLTPFGSWVLPAPPELVAQNLKAFLNNADLTDIYSGQATSGGFHFSIERGDTNYCRIQITPHPIGCRMKYEIAPGAVSRYSLYHRIMKDAVLSIAASFMLQLDAMEMKRRPKETLNPSHFTPSGGENMTTIVQDERDEILTEIRAAVAVAARELIPNPHHPGTLRITYALYQPAQCAHKIISFALAEVARRWSVQILPAASDSPPCLRIPGYWGVHTVALFDQGDHTLIDWSHMVDAPPDSPLHVHSGAQLCPFHKQLELLAPALHRADPPETRDEPMQTHAEAQTPAPPPDLQSREGDQAFDRADPPETRDEPMQTHAEAQTPAPPPGPRSRKGDQRFGRVDPLYTRNTQMRSHAEAQTTEPSPDPRSSKGYKARSNSGPLYTRNGQMLAHGRARTIKPPPAPRRGEKDAWERVFEFDAVTRYWSTDQAIADYYGVGHSTVSNLRSMLGCQKRQMIRSIGK